MPILFLLMLSSLHLFAGTLNIQEAWTNISSPLLMGTNYETRLSKLPAQGKVSEPSKFWSGDYWAMAKGNINYRWNASANYTLKAPTTRDQLASITSADIARLSPAEKFDLLNGRYDYPLKAEVKKLTAYDAESWEGICHGWAPASMNHNEPKPKILTNPDGIKIYFGSADIKAILSYYYAFPYQVADTHQVGRRCEDEALKWNEDCRQDLNAGAFHLILTNRIGLENKGFIADMNRFKEVWNHPIMSYRTRIKKQGRAKRDSAPGTVRTVKYATTITYTAESINSWNVLIGTNQQRTMTQEMVYNLDINANGEIIGGEWKSSARPDFLWIKEKPAAFTGDYERLAGLLND